MSITYGIKILGLSPQHSALRVVLTPLNQPLAPTLRRNIAISKDRILEIVAMPTTTERREAIREEIIRGNAGYQADWATALAYSSPAVSDIIDDLEDSFLEPTTADEVAVPDPTETPTGHGEVTL